ncbi:MAG TPA: hypothetical protein VFU02_10895 [Polyangiaceae bacterium]|nr:hypothetical protein [Polyangiaceae bacterium]
MRSIATILLTVGLLTFSRIGGQALAKHSEPRELTAAAVHVDGRDRPKPHTTEPKRMTTRRGTVVVTPGECFQGFDAFDVVFHFHGNPFLVERAWRRNTLNAALFIMNHGETTKPYAERYSYREAFDQLITSAERYVKELCPNAPAKVGRIALSGWSAGYASIQKLIRDDAHAARVDAVLLSDGLHTGLVNKYPRTISETGLEPFVAFGKQALTDGKLMVMTHSAIPTVDFASTTETTDAVLHSLGLLRVLHLDEERLGALRMTSEVHEHSFHLMGFEGTEARDHGDHLRQLDNTLFNHLRDRWQVAPE